MKTRKDSLERHACHEEFFTKEERDMIQKSLQKQEDVRKFLQSIWKIKKHMRRKACLIYLLLFTLCGTILGGCGQNTNLLPIDPQLEKPPFWGQRPSQAESRAHLPEDFSG